MGKRKGLTTGAAVLIGSVAIVLTLVGGFLLLWFQVIKPANKEKRSRQSVAGTTAAEASASPAAEMPPSGDPGIPVIETPTPTDEQPEIHTPEPETNQTAEPIIEPTQEPIEEPTPAPADITPGPVEEPTPAPADITPEPVDEPTTAPADVTPEPTEEPTPAMTEEPTPEPTPEPAEEPMPAPTKKPDSFTFGGKTIKTGTKKINGDKLGINGKSGSLRHITEEEVENLVALCPDLETLSLDYCYMDDYEPLGALVKLKTLKLRRCDNGGKGNAVDDIEWVEGLKNLSYLHLGHNEVGDLTPLKGLKKLKRLNLGYNDIENDDLEDLSVITTLTELSLYGNKKISDVSPLASLTNLTYLNLGYNSKIKSVKSLTGLKNLRKLRINKTKISDISYLRDFESLEWIDISGCPIKSKNYYHFWYCEKLSLIVTNKDNADVGYLLGNESGVSIEYEWPD